MRPWVNLAAVFVCMGVALSLNAQNLNKCTDASGNVTYSDKACETGDAIASVHVSTVDPAGSESQQGYVRVTHNMKTLRACEIGKQEACFEKQLIEERCRSQRNKGTGVPLTDCKDFESDRAIYNKASDDCKQKTGKNACLFLFCIDGDSKSCGLLVEAENKNQTGMAKRIDAARKQGLPAGYGWYMSQDWYTYSDGSQAAIVTCNIPGKPDSGNTSVALRKVPPMTQRILTSVTGREYFLTVDEAGRKACSKFK